MKPVLPRWRQPVRGQAPMGTPHHRTISMDELATARFRGYSHLQKEFADLDMPGINYHERVETSRQLHIHLRSDGSVPAAIQELFDRLNQEAAWLEITQQEDDSFTFRVITPIICN